MPNRIPMNRSFRKTLRELKIPRWQKEWIKLYHETTEYEPLIDDFALGNETFDEMRRANVQWFEDHIRSVVGNLSQDPAPDAKEWNPTTGNFE
jgi:hypothetical protein